MYEIIGNYFMASSFDWVLFHFVRAVLSIIPLTNNTCGVSVSCYTVEGCIRLEQSIQNSRFKCSNWSFIFLCRKWVNNSSWVNKKSFFFVKELNFHHMSAVTNAMLQDIRSVVCVCVILIGSFHFQLQIWWWVDTTAHTTLVQWWRPLHL